MSTLAALQQILIEEFDLQPEQLTPDAQLSGLGIDSLGVVDFMFKVEDHFDLKIKDDVPTLLTVNDVVVYIDTLLAEKAGNGGPAAAALNSTP